LDAHLPTHFFLFYIKQNLPEIRRFLKKGWMMCQKNGLQTGPLSYDARFHESGKLPFVRRVESS